VSGIVQTDVFDCSMLNLYLCGIFIDYFNWMTLSSAFTHLPSPDLSAVPQEPNNQDKAVIAKLIKYILSVFGQVTELSDASSKNKDKTNSIEVGQFMIIYPIINPYV
jgi:hypothetical protein